MPNHAHEILGMTVNPGNALGWHLCISQGVPAIALKNTAKLLGVTEKTIAEMVLHTTALPRKGELSREASDFAYRFAQAWALLVSQKGVTPARAADWLKSPQPALKDHIPLMLLRTNQGQGYAMTAIERMA